MSEPLFTRCSICQGAGHFDHGDGRTVCPCVRTDHPGYAHVGLTLGQLDRMAERERVLQGDPGVPAERAGKVVADIRARLKRLEQPASFPPWD